MKTKSKLLSEKAYGKIKQAIVTGVIESNTILFEQAAAKTLRMSRTPVRTALMKLAEEGLVKNLPNSGFLVTAVTLKEIEEIFDLRLCLETYVTELVINNDIPIDLSEMEKYIKTQETALEKKDFWSSFEANHQFHINFINIAQNDTMTRFLVSLKDKPIQSGYRSLHRGANLSEAIEEHKAIVKALKKRDKKRVIAELKRHAKNAKRRTLGIYL